MNEGIIGFNHCTCKNEYWKGNIKISNPFLYIIMKLYSHHLVIKYLQDLMIVIK